MEASRLPIVQNVPIHEDAIVPCPLHDFQAVRACQFCPECEYFDGVVSLQPAYKKPVDMSHVRWEQRYAMRCKYPIERKFSIIKIKEKPE